MKHRVGRRSFLHGVGGLAVALPLLESLTRPSKAAAAGLRGASLRSVRGPLAGGAAPKRFLVFWTPNGTHPTNWFPKGSGSQYTMSPYLQPLEGQRSNFSILKGIDMPSANSGAGDDHQRGIGACLTGTQTISAGGGPIGGGISLDQVIANEIGKTTKFRSLELGVQSYFNGDTIYERISYRGANQPIPPERDPFAAYKRIFGSFQPSGGVPDIAMIGRRSVLDHVGAEYRSLLSKLGGSDRNKLDAHLTTIRELEGRLSIGNSQASGCKLPQVGSAFDASAPGKFRDTGRIHMDLLVMALACDLTRVGSIMFSYGRSKHVFNWLDSSIAEEHHDLSHKTNPDSGSSPDTVAVEKIRKINLHYASQFSYLLERLQSVPEGEGTLLDNTIVLWCNELGEGRAHTHTDIPIILGGRGGGTLRPGRLLSYEGRSTNDLYVSLLNAMGIAASTFGDEQHNNGALPDLG